MSTFPVLSICCAMEIYIDLSYKNCLCVKCSNLIFTCMARQISKAALKALGKFSEVMVYMDWVYKKISTIFFLVAQMTNIQWDGQSLMDPSRSKILQRNQRNRDFTKFNYAFKRSTDQI